MSDDKQTPSVKFRYEKSPAYQEARVDGLFGGITPKGEVHVYLYTEVLPMPTSIEHRLEQSGRLGSELARDIDRGIVRFVHAGITLDVETARSLRNWLDDKLEGVDDEQPDGPGGDDVEGRGET